MILTRYIFVFLIATLVLPGCSNHLHEDIVMFENGWHQDSMAVFEFEVEDTSGNYNISYKVRNNLDYPYYNFYLKYTLVDVKEDRTMESSLQQIILMDPKTGKPYGKGFTDVYQHSFLGLKDYQFPHPGRYRLMVQQYMRQEQLEGILSFGITVDENQDSQ